MYMKELIDDFINCRCYIYISTYDELRKIRSVCESFGFNCNRSSLHDYNYDEFPYVFYEHQGIHGYANEQSDCPTYTFDYWINFENDETDLAESDFDLEFILSWRSL
jgi:hypothetical protein